MKRGGRGSKDKGSGFERELAAWLQHHVGLDCYRAPLSGGGEGVNLRMTLGADLVGTPGIHVEAKRTERFAPEAALRQAEESITKVPTPERFPVVINRKNRQKIEDGMVVMRLSDWAALYAAYVRERNHESGGV